MSEKSEENKVSYLFDELILLIFSFIRNPFHNSIPVPLLFSNKSDYIEKYNSHKIYCNFCDSCKLLYNLKYKDSYIIFNKEYSIKYNDSKKFREEVSIKIDITKLLIYCNRCIIESPNTSYSSSFMSEKLYNDSFPSSHSYDYLHLINSNDVKISFNNIKLFTTYKEVLKFLKLENSQVIKISYIMVMKHITDFVKKERISGNSDIYVEGNFKRFKLIGELKTLFDFIKKQMIIRGDLENPEKFPIDISYFEVLKYIIYCFPETNKIIIPKFNINNYYLY